MRSHRQAVLRKVVASVTLAVATSGLAFAQDAFLPSPVRMASTVPSNGDVNPYGVAFIKNNFQAGSGPLKPGDILVSNFNNKNNLQGTGRTIIRIPQSGSPTTFYTSLPSEIQGLSTGLGTLQNGFVLVASLPTEDGTAKTAKPGYLDVINNKGVLIETFANNVIQGPWDMAVVDKGNTATVFVSNALNGTVGRMDFAVSNTRLTLLDRYTIASGYLHQGDPAALFDAPTGLVYDANTDDLYVASTLDNAVFVVSNASTRTTSAGPGSIVYRDNVHLHGALAMAEAPNGHLLVTNNDVINADPNQPSEIVEFTKQGEFVKEIPVDPNLGGSFGLQVNTGQVAGTATLAAVDDNTATITIWTLPLD